MHIHYLTPLHTHEKTEHIFFLLFFVITDYKKVRGTKKDVDIKSGYLEAE